jgi:hypothetical protein
MNHKIDIENLYNDILLNEVAGSLNYWLTKSGELIKINDHVSHAIENFPELVNDYYLEDGELYHSNGDTMDINEIYEIIYSYGYIRVVEDTNSIYFVYNLGDKPNKKQFEALIDHSNTKNKNLIDGVTQKPVYQKNDLSAPSRPESLVKMDTDMQPSFYNRDRKRSYYSESDKFKLNDYTKLVYENNDEDEDEDIETVGIRGEYWFDDMGDPIYADGDIGDVGHEGIVINIMAGNLCSEFDIYEEEPFFDYNSSSEIAILEKISQDHDYVKEKYADSLEGDDDNIDEYHVMDILKNDPADSIIQYLVYNGMSEENANDLVLIAYGSSKDAREYAINQWNWKRVQGKFIESKALTSKDLKIIASGINSAIDMEGLRYEYEEDPRALDLHEYEISTYTGKRYSISLIDMESGNVEGLERSDIEIKNSAAAEQLRKMDVDSMPDFYKNKNIIGDSYKHLFMNDYKKLINED